MGSLKNKETLELLKEIERLQREIERLNELVRYYALRKVD